MSIEFKPLPPAEAVAWFKSKGYAIGFNWRDVWKEEHAVAFTVAKAMRQDILEDIRGAVDTAISKGVPFQTFKKNLAPVLAAKGWWGRKEMEDPVTGEIVNAQLGSDRRLRIIYDTNLRTAHAAGRWQRIQRVKARRPYLRYVAVLDERTREDHRRWHGIVLPVDHPFWLKHYPPNGWRCRCTVMQLSNRDLDRNKWAVSDDPPEDLRPYEDQRHGRSGMIPNGIDPGFDYNVGVARLRAFTPPPAGGLPVSFPIGNLPDLPKPRAANPERLLSEGLSEQDYVDRFLAEFGATREKPVSFIDKVGEPLTISADLFTAADGVLKATKAGRAPYLLLLADSIKNPDEIWWVWELGSKTKKPILRRRYISRFDLGDTQAPALSVFEFDRSGWEWNGVTNFAPNQNRGPASQDRQLERQRDQLLAYRRKK